MDSITIDGRFLILFVAIIILFIAFIIETLNIWLENQDHRKARAWDDQRARPSFIDWLIKLASANKTFQRTLIICSVPFIVFLMVVRHPVLIIKKAAIYFEKEFNSLFEFIKR